MPGWGLILTSPTLYAPFEREKNYPVGKTSRHSLGRTNPLVLSVPIQELCVSLASQGSKRSHYTSFEGLFVSKVPSHPQPCFS